MRIGILIDEYAPGAQPVLAMQEAEGLKKNGFEADILVGTKFTYKHLEGALRESPVIFLTDKYPRWVRKISFRFPFFSFFSPQHILSVFFAPRVIKEGEYDAIIAHGLFSAFIALNLRRKRRIPFVTLFWDPSSYILPKVYRNTPLRLFSWALVPIIGRIDEAIAKVSNRLMLGSRFHLKWFTEQGVRNIQIVYPGCIPAQSLPEKRGDFVLAVDRWDIGSKPDMFLEIVYAAKNKFTLKIVGHWHDENSKNSFLSKINELGLGKYVEIIGHVTSQRLRQLFFEARCFVHPTIEAFGMAALEAASCGCPIIIPRGSGVTDLFIHGQHGFFPEEKNIQEYAMYMESFVTDQALAYKMGYAAWEVAKKYTWDFHAQQLTRIIQECLTNEKARV